jgi:Leucine-rich repeat (LRR) protein
MLQQNGLCIIPTAFLSFSKLKELRLDRNGIEKLENLSGCSSLKMLDVSYNQLTTLEVCYNYVANQTSMNKYCTHT